MWCTFPGRLCEGPSHSLLRQCCPYYRLYYISWYTRPQEGNKGRVLMGGWLPKYPQGLKMYTLWSRFLLKINRYAETGNCSAAFRLCVIQPNPKCLWQISRLSWLFINSAQFHLGEKSNQDTWLIGNHSMLSMLPFSGWISTPVVIRNTWAQTKKMNRQMENKYTVHQGT